MKCSYCEGSRVLILRVPDATSKVGFRQVAKLCDHQPPPAIRDGKAAAANDTEGISHFLSAENQE